METLAYNTSLALTRQFGRSGLMQLGRSNVNLLWWIPLTALRLVGDVILRRSRSYLFGEALTWALFSWIPRAAGIPALTMVCGLDITYSNPAYRAVVHRALRKSPRVLAISRATLGQAIEVGVDPSRGHIITMGLEAPHGDPTPRGVARAQLLKDMDLPADAILLLTTGRLVKRKGVAWFVREVMPLLGSRFHYLVVGTGPDHDTILAAAEAGGVSDRVHLLGRVSDAARDSLLAGVDLFVQPNIPVDHDMEGFGLVVVESAQAGLLTVAADLEGLRDAVRPGVTGFAAPSGDAPAWAQLLTELAARPDRAPLADGFRQTALEIYSLDTMGAELREHIEAIEAR